MTAKDDLLRYLRTGREALVWKLEGLSEYDARRPMTPTGTNVLGLTKHVASMGCLYLGDAFDRPRPDVTWLAADAPDDADLWATRDESRELILEFWSDAWRAADDTVASLDLDAVGEVPWWSPERRRPTLHTVLVHLVGEVDRHAGHADIVRELIDGAAGLRADNDNLAGDGAWDAHTDRLARIADTFR